MRIKLITFNKVNANGVIYIAESKEYIDKLVITEDGASSSYLVNVPIIDPNLNYDERFKIASTVDFHSLCGVIREVEIIETGDIGFKDLPVYEVYGEVKPIANDNGKLFSDLYNENLVSIGIRSWARHLPENVQSIGKIICWDVVPK